MTTAEIITKLRTLVEFVRLGHKETYDRNYSDQAREATQLVGRLIQLTYDYPGAIGIDERLSEFSDHFAHVCGVGRLKVYSVEEQWVKADHALAKAIEDIRRVEASDGGRYIDRDQLPE